MERFTYYIINFVFRLLPCSRVNGISILVNRATKWVTLILLHKSVTVARAADLFLRWLVWCYRMLQDIIVDHDPCFMSDLWQ